VQICEERFIRPDNFDLGEFWKNWCVEEEQSYTGYPVRVRVSKNALPSVLRRFGASAQNQLAGTVEAEDGSRVLTLYFRWIDDARERLLPLGSGVEVLEPFALRASLADITEQTARLYHQ